MRLLLVAPLLSHAGRVPDVFETLGPLLAVLSGGGLPAFGERHPRWTRRVLGRFDHLVAPSAHLGRWAETLAEVPVTVIPNPLDLGPYPFRPRGPVAPSVLWLRAYHE